MDAFLPVDNFHRPQLGFSQLGPATLGARLLANYCVGAKDTLC